MVIYKYEIPVRNMFGVPLPVDSKILDIQDQSGQLTMWVLHEQPTIESNVSKEMRYFSVYGTGQPIPKFPGQFIATVQSNGFVWHIFENE